MFNIEKIVIDTKLDNWNTTINKNRKNRFMAASSKKKEMAIVHEFIKDIEPIVSYPIRLICEWHIKNMISDLDNKSLKAVLDQMQIDGILENDNCKHITEITYKAVKDDKDYLVIYIEEVCDDTRGSRT